MSTMRAAVLVGPRRIEICDAALPQPGDGEVLVHLEGCGVCASNLPPWEGRPWFEHPFEPGAPGHEGWGRVVDTGRAVKDFAPGDRVGMISGHAFAEYDVADAGAIVRLPEEVDRVPFPAEPLGCAVNVLRRADVREGMTVAVVGTGFLGILLVRLAKLAGARVIAVGRKPETLEVAARYGADACVQSVENQHARTQVEILTDGGQCEVVIECAGKQEPLDLAAELTRERGRLVIAGYHQDGPRQVNMQLWNWRGIDVINAHERDPAVYRRGMEQAVRLVAEGRLDPSPLLTHELPLEEIGRAFEAADQREPGFVKAWIRL